MNAEIQQLTVLFDAQCAICRRAHIWLNQQAHIVPLTFVPLQAEDLRVRFPGIEQLALKDELTVLGPDGEYWRGVDAWLMTLWALEEWRLEAIELAQPMWRPLARRLIIELSNNRYWLSSLIERGDEENLQAALYDETPNCEEEQCVRPPELPHRHAPTNPPRQRAARARRI